MPFTRMNEDMLASSSSAPSASPQTPDSDGTCHKKRGAHHAALVPESHAARSTESSTGSRVNRLPALAGIADSSIIGPSKESPGPEKSSDLTDFEAKAARSRLELSSNTRANALADLPVRAQLAVAAAEQSQLHDMASLGRVHDVEQLIQAGADREKADAFGRTPLHLAAALGHEAVVRLLARLSAHLGLMDSMGQAPLHLAAHHGQKRVIDALLELRADINMAAKSDRTPLHFAVEGRQADVCRQLLHLKADAEARDGHKDTALTLATRVSHTTVLDVLIENRCDHHARHEDGATPLHIAACKQRLECIEVLVQRSARIEGTDSYGMTPLHWAARSGEPEAVESLIQHKGNATGRTTAERQTPLHLATMADELECIEVVIKHGADIDAQDIRGYTSLHTAVEHCRLDALEGLLKLGVNRDLQTKQKDTALHLACRHARPDFVRCLLKHGCGANSRGRGGHSPLHVACERGTLACVSMLLDPASRTDLREKGQHATDPKHVICSNPLDSRKQTPLHIAGWNGRVDLCELLCAYNAEVDALDCEQFTPLSLAVSKDHDSAVQMLLRLAADPMRRNPQELAPLQQACVCNSLTVAKTLNEMRMLPKADEPPWRRPMALAKFYGNQEIVDYFFKPCPASKLCLSMPRAISSTVISVSFGAIIAEPPVNVLKVQIVPAPPVGAAISEDLFDAENLTAERELSEADWTTGKTIQVDGLSEGLWYLCRLLATSDAGTTVGDSTRIQTKVDGPSSPSIEKRSPRAKRSQTRSECEGAGEEDEQSKGPRTATALSVDP